MSETQNPLLWLRDVELMTTVTRHTLIPPYGYNICGVWGSCAQWVDGFGVIIRK